jgi:hypothetical protein
MSINEMVSIDFTTVKYISWHEIVAIANAVGKGGHLVKIDLAEAYRQLGIRPEDWHFLGINYNGIHYIDTREVFGDTGAGRKFNNFADALEWIGRKIAWIELFGHFLDDFIFGNQNEKIAASQLQTFLALLKMVNVPVSLPKIEKGQEIQILGVTFNTNSQTMRIPQQRINKVLETLHHFMENFGLNKRVTKHDALSLAGILLSANRVIYHGIPFISGLFKMCQQEVDQYDTVPISLECFNDLSWFKNTLLFHASRSYVPLPGIDSFPKQRFSSDASNTGCAGIIGQQAWALLWNTEELSLVIGLHQIATGEAYAVFVNLWLHAHEWTNHAITLFCDNKTVVEGFRSGDCDNQRVVKLFKHMENICLVHNIDLSLIWLCSKDNCISDSLSRGDAVCIFQNEEIHAALPVDAKGTSPPPLISLIK